MMVLLSGEDEDANSDNNMSYFNSVDTHDPAAAGLDEDAGSGSGSNFTGSDAVTYPDPEYYDPEYRITGSILTSLIFVVGLVGNVLVVVVVSRTRSLHGHPTNCYLVSVALADILLLVSAAMPTIIEYYVIVDEWVMAGSVGCSVAVFLQYLGVNVSSLSITAFTVERYIAICHPIRAQTMCTVRRARRIIVMLWVFGVSYCGPWLALATTVPMRLSNGATISRCTFTLPRNYYVVYYVADLVIFYAVPLMLTCVLYALIARTLCYSGRSAAAVDTRVSKPDTALHGRESNQRDYGNCPKTTLSVVARSAISSSRIQVVKMLAVVVAMFATLWLPYRTYVVYNSFARERFENRWFLLFCRLSVYTNSAINPILYNAMSVKFRQAFRRLLLPICGSKVNSSQKSKSEVELLRLDRARPGRIQHCPAVRDPTKTTLKPQSAPSRTSTTTTEDSSATFDSDMASAALGGTSALIVYNGGARSGSAYSSLLVRSAVGNSHRS